LPIPSQLPEEPLLPGMPIVVLLLGPASHEEGPSPSFTNQAVVHDHAYFLVLTQQVRLAFLCAVVVLK